MSNIVTVRKMKVKVIQSCWLFVTPWTTVHGILQARILEQVDFPFSRGSLTQGSNPDLLHCRWILYQLSHKGSPRILEWVAYPFSRGSSWHRNWTGVSCVAGRFFASWATREAQSWGEEIKNAEWLNCVLNWQLSNWDFLGSPWLGHCVSTSGNTGLILCWS